ADAMESHERALAADPGHVGALLHLVALRAGDPAALAPTLERLARATTDPALAARALAEAAALPADRLANPAEATRLWLAAHAAEPGDRALARRAILHLERVGDEAALIDVLRAEAARGGAAGAAAAYRLARIHLRAGREDEALAALVRARAL